MLVLSRSGLIRFVELYQCLGTRAGSEGLRLGGHHGVTETACQGVGQDSLSEVERAPLTHRSSSHGTEVFTIKGKKLFGILFPEFLN